MSENVAPANSESVAPMDAALNVAVATSYQPSLFSVEDFPVRTSVSQDTETDWTAPKAASGLTCSASFASYDRATSSWKTSQLCFTGDLATFSADWPRAGLMQSGSVYPRPHLEPRIYATDCLSWPTPRSSDGRAARAYLRKAPRGNLEEIIALRGDLGWINPPFLEWLLGYPINWTALAD